MQDHTMTVQYFIKRKEKINGPFSLNQIQKAINSSQIKSQDQISVSEDGPWDGMKDVYKQILDGSYVHILESLSEIDDGRKLNSSCIPQEGAELSNKEAETNIKEHDDYLPESSEELGSPNSVNENDNFLIYLGMLSVLGVIIGFFGLIVGLTFAKEIFWISLGFTFLIAILFSGTEEGLRIQQEQDEKKRLAQEEVLNKQAKIICPHCHERGHVTTQPILRKKGLSGGKATAAVVTGGVSILATGLSRKEAETEASCANCGSKWYF